MQLQRNSKGKKVEELQQMLRDAGFFTYPTNTGFFGPETERALVQYQRSIGVPSNGVYDDTIAKKLSSQNNYNSLMSSPAIQSTDWGMALKELYDSGDPRADQLVGLFKDYQANPALLANGDPISEDIFAEALGRSATELDPYYTQERAYTKGAADQAIGEQNKSYGNNIFDLAAAAQADKAQQDINEGTSGTWASSARQDRRNSLQSLYNRKAEDAYNTAQSNLSNTYRNLEYNYGSSALDNLNKNLGKTTFDFNTNSPTVNSSNIDTTIYNPSNFSGRKPAERLAGIMDRTQERLSGYFKKPTL